MAAEADDYAVPARVIMTANRATVPLSPAPPSPDRYK